MSQSYTTAASASARADAAPAGSARADALIPLEDILELHRALVRARARSIDLDEFLADVLETLRTHLGAEGAFAGLCNPDCDCFDHAVAVGAAPAPLQQNHLYQPLPCHSQGVADRDARVAEWAAAVAAGSPPDLLAASALLFRGEQIGLLCLFGRPEARRPWQQEALSAAALEIGLAVAHLRLRQDMANRLRERNERWSSLYEVAVSLARVMDSDQLLDELVRRAISLLRTRGGALSVTDPTTGETVVTVAYLNGVPSKEMLGFRLPPGEGLAAEVIRSGRTLHLSDYTFITEPRIRPGLRTSVIAAPLFVQNAPVGVLAVGDDPASRRFNQDDVQTIELLAQAAGAILEKAHGRTQEQTLTIHRERARLARELHDGLAQNLASLLLKAELCHDIARDAEPDLARHIDGLAEGLQQAVRETRAAIATLREAPSDGQRLMDALKLLTSRFESQSRIPAGLSWEGDADRVFPTAARIALLGVAQEALSNVRKHARAQSVCVHLNASSPNTIELSVYDDGCGFEPPPPGSTGGMRFGLLGMRERMEELGGSLRIDTAPGCGVTVTATLPLR